MTPCAAGTVRIVVREKDGPPVSDALLVVRPPESSRVGSPRPQGARYRRGSTDVSGATELSGLPAGQYEVSFARLHPMLVRPRDNPFTSKPRFTLEDDDSTVVLVVEVWRGLPVGSQMQVDRGEIRSARVRFREINRQVRFEFWLRGEEHKERVVLPGRWEVVLDPPPGFLLTDLELNARSIEGHRVQLDLRPGDPASYVTWYFSAPAKITGKVYFRGPRFGVGVTARLVEPGLWIEAARRRGGSRYHNVRAGLREDGSYEMVVPDGLWELRAVGAELVQAEPESVDLALGPGDERSVNFTVEGDPDRREMSVLLVEAHTPDGRRLDGGATVEVWPLDPAKRQDIPVARRRIRYRHAWIPVPNGDYVVAAGHPRYLEGHAEVRDLESSREEPELVRVRLREAARLHAIALDTKEDPVEGVQLMLERLDDGPEMLMTDPDLVAAARNPRIETDATGHAWLEGAWPGKYRVRGELQEPDRPTRFVRFDQGHGRVAQELEISLSAGADRELDVLVLPAANLTGRLGCADGRELPGTATSLVLPAGRELATLRASELESEAELLLVDQPLAGELRDTFLAGPLDGGAYFLALRPKGFDRWTWALGTEQPGEASALQATLGDSIDVGYLEIDCGPAIRLAPTVRSGDPLPDLSDVHPRKDALWVSGQVKAGQTFREVSYATVDAYPDQLVLRGLPEGRARLTVTLRNGFFLPQPELVFRVEGELEEGRTLHGAPSILAVGGIVRLESEAGAAARLIAETEDPRIEPLSSGAAEFWSVPPGEYSLELCLDPDCAAVLQSWRNIRVRPLDRILIQ